MAGTPTHWMVNRYDPLDNRIKDKQYFKRKHNAIKYAGKIGGSVYGFIPDAIAGIWMPLERLETEAHNA